MSDMAEAFEEELSSQLEIFAFAGSDESGFLSSLAAEQFKELNTILSRAYAACLAANVLSHFNFDGRRRTLYDFLPRSFGNLDIDLGKALFEQQELIKSSWPAPGFVDTRLS